MFQLIKNFVNRLTIGEVDSFLKKNNINLSEAELDFTFRFVKKNYEALFVNPNIDLSRYKDKYSEENYSKLMKLVLEYKNKYANYLN